MANGKMTTCKHCGAEVAASAKTCPQCGGKISKPIYKRIWFWILIGILVIGIGGAIGGSDTTSKDVQNNTQNEAPAQQDTAVQDDTAAQQEAPAQEEVIEYAEVTVDQMTDALDNNPAAASDEYKGKYFSVTGKLDNIDSSGKYISLTDINDEWSIIGVTCYIKNADQLDQVKQMSMGQEVTVKGKVTTVGEVLG
ncbi:MAG: zinc-ribbon domain-containing protein, partial [Firmicutes bacterium]|nr:zinc-ribbon domain-containing protein [Bacillota bacterium]